MTFYPTHVPDRRLMTVASLGIEIPSFVPPDVTYVTG